MNVKIQKVNKLIFKAKKDQKNALEDLKDLNQKIEVREQLIATINLEAKLLSNEITSNEKKIAQLDKKLATLKKDYADMIYKSYKSKSQQSRIMFLLSSKNFRQAYKRLQYMKQYTSFRKKQGEEITVQTLLITQLIDSLTLQKKEKDTLVLFEKEEKKKIEVDQEKKKSLVSQIKKKEKNIRKNFEIRFEKKKELLTKLIN
ncbi:hypothetical protein [Polaribacter sp. HL-MS24]|uniref:murein hydrolase activator EnvC family protein n=1 Tax=Polaribacter sp. HL-MS24 TaxID=3077735 RepID=UPI0029342859|nr:hypothetical protein [Polaribacter sp. HL-MS24]WOC39258.1 hypothetical protein RRF69_06060 [Polaribacter sp. HL-MS24]